jgi:hypothetical protein
MAKSEKWAFTQKAIAQTWQIATMTGCPGQAKGGTQLDGQYPHIDHRRRSTKAQKGLTWSPRASQI